MVEVHQNLRAEVAGGISWRDRDITLVPWGLPSSCQLSSTGEPGVFSPKPFQCSPAPAWPLRKLFGKSLINDGLIASGEGCACGQGRVQGDPAPFPNILNASGKDISATLLCFFFLKCQLNWLCSHQEATKWKETQLQWVRKVIFVILSWILDLMEA